jgi:hypothetical protein
MKYFITYWAIVFSFIPLIFVFAFTTYWWISIVLIIASVWCRSDYMRVAVRAGAFGIAPYPCSSEELLKTYAHSRPTIVGKAWGFYIRRENATGLTISMRHFKGKGSGKYSGWWAAGTTIDEVLQQSVKTFPSHPSQADVTIGSWFAMGCHGSGGDAGSPSSSVFSRAEVVCFDPPSVETVKTYKRLRQIFDRRNHNSVITWIQFHNMADNITVQKRAFDVNNVHSASKWLSEGAILRVLFVGAARDGLGIRWELPYEETDHIDPHCCSKRCTFLQSDACSAVCGCKENYSKWNGRTSLREANRWVPYYLFPLATFITAITNYRNFEVAFRYEMNPERLYAMVAALREMHKQIGGRTEIRFGTSIVFWDLSLRDHFDAPFQILKSMNVQRLAYHPSKAHVGIYIIPVVSIGDIYFNNNTEKLKFIT